MIIYIYQGMMALGRGGVHDGEAEKTNAGRGGWGKKKLFGVKQMLKGWHQ